MASLCKLCRLRSPSKDYVTCEQCRERKRLREYRRKHRPGICHACGSRPSAPGRKVCLICRIKDRDRARERSKTRCTRCHHGKRVPGGTRCAHCIRTKRHQCEERRDVGLCWMCGAKKEPQFTRCLKCRLKGNANYKKWAKKNRAYDLEQARQRREIRRLGIN